MIAGTRFLLLPMVEAARRGAPSAALLDLVRAHGLALCVFRPTTVDDVSDARPTLRVMLRTLERRRPLAAAFLAAAIEHHRWRLS